MCTHLFRARILTCLTIPLPTFLSLLTFLPLPTLLPLVNFLSLPSILARMLDCMGEEEVDESQAFFFTSSTGSAWKLFLVKVQAGAYGAEVSGRQLPGVPLR